MDENYLQLKKLFLSQPLFHKPDFVKDPNKKFLMKRGSINMKSKRFYLNCVSKTCSATCIYIYNDTTNSLAVHDGHAHVYSGCMLVDEDVQFKLDDINDKFELKLYLDRVISYCKEKNIEIKTYESTQQENKLPDDNNVNNANNSKDVPNCNTGSAVVPVNQEMFDQDVYGDYNLDIFDNLLPEEDQEEEDLSNEEICKRFCSLYEEYKQNLRETEEYTDKNLKFVADHLSDYFVFLKSECHTSKFDMAFIKSGQFFDSVVKYLEDTVVNAQLSDKTMYHRWMQFTDFFTWLLEVNMKNFDDDINLNLLKSLNSIQSGVKMSCKDMNHDFDVDGEHQEDPEYSDDDDFVLNSSKKKNNSHKKRKGRNTFSNKNPSSFSHHSSNKKKPVNRRKAPVSVPLSKVDEEKERERKKLQLQDLRKTIESQNIKVQSQYLIFENQTLRLGSIENKIDDILKNLMENQMHNTTLPHISSNPTPSPPLVQSHPIPIPQNRVIMQNPYQQMPIMYYNTQPNYTMTQTPYQFVSQQNFQKPN